MTLSKSTDDAVSSQNTFELEERSVFVSPGKKKKKRYINPTKYAVSLKKIFPKLPNRNFPSPGNEVTEARCKFLLTSDSLSLTLVREHRQQTATTQSWNRDGTGELGHIWPVSWHRDSDFVWRGMWKEMSGKIHTDARDIRWNILRHTVHVPLGRYCAFLVLHFSQIFGMLCLSSNAEVL